ncbi:MAG TPA: aldolase catalytic domain-containing protein [Geobacteraceae bacterium]
MEPVVLDCTFRDGGYHNDWDFTPDVVQDYLRAMTAVGADYVELGFRSLENQGFKGPFAYSTDRFIRSLSVPASLKLGVMVNASEIVKYPEGSVSALTKLFAPASQSPVALVRLACHYPELAGTLKACDWLKEQGYTVGINLMQISDRTPEEIEQAGKLAAEHPLDVLYFADSLGGLLPDQVAGIIRRLRTNWSGALGFHAHDNLGNALANTMRAYREGAVWLDSTVTGMGRGPGNAKTEYLALELADQRMSHGDVTPLLSVIRKHFKPMQDTYGWGTNTYYYLAGKYGIHPTYIQEMLSDSRFSDEDILAVIQHLQKVGGKKYNVATLETGRHFFQGEARGTWSPSEMIAGREVLILGPGAGVSAHRHALEEYIENCHPFVIALNTLGTIAPHLINIRAACHPVRMLADCGHYAQFPQPLATPASMLPGAIRQALSGAQLLDYGLTVREKAFEFHSTHCVIPTSLVLAYALAIAASGDASRILLAGFDGYSADDPRRSEVDTLFHYYMQARPATMLAAITPTKYEIPSLSLYAL